eukprot:TRINITY_DN1463_c1_g3_i1.p1 TRINITY_DN1463_c1_g3~~TRINITY_DN1463_c1_g3_i1.p1  ORF type:complete len:1366 (+),score=478.60 TRINITY_DN1463_c1_g3_i1:113-4210(+)
MVECVKVVVRLRPMNGKEKARGCTQVVTMKTELSQVHIRNPKNPDCEPKAFTFDAVYDIDSLQKSVYDDTGYPLVESVMNGYNGTMFAYGQTGCGKTHTMQGKDEPPEMRGIIPNSFVHIFENITSTPDKEFLIRCAYTEIYNEEVRDLLGKDCTKKLDLKQDPEKGVFVKDLSWHEVKTVTEIDSIMKAGYENRSVGATEMNAESSRSHSIFMIEIETHEIDEGQDVFRKGKLNLVDLAGSERQSKTQATGARLKEGIKINLSLTALGNVISALVDGKGKHIPYRDSKLTRLLEDSLGGNTKTVMMAALSPADYNYDETLSTLRYANRAKNIKNKPSVNEDPKDALLRKYKEEIEQLKQMLAQAAGSGPLPAAALELLAGLTPPEASSSHNHKTIADAPQPDSNNNNQDTDDNKASEINMLSGSDAQTRNALTGEINSVMPSMGNGNITSMPSIPTTARGVTRISTSNVDQTLPTSPAVVAKNARESVDPNNVTSTPTTTSPIARQSARASMNAMAANQLPPPSFDVRSPRPSEVKTVVIQAEPQIITKTEVQVKEVEVVREVEVVKKEIVEVVSKQHLAEQIALQNYSKAVEDQRNRMGDELQKKQNEVEKERIAREELGKKLAQLTKKVIGGSKNSDTDPEVLLAQQQASYRRAQYRLKQRKKAENRAKAKKEEMQRNQELLAANLQGMQDQVAEKDEMIEKMKLQHESTMHSMEEEIEDLQTEFENERSAFLDTIREQNRQMRLFEQLVNLFLTSKQLRRVFEKSVWDEDIEEWKLPKIKEKKKFEIVVPLPSIRRGSSRAGSNSNIAVTNGSGSNRQQLRSAESRDANLPLTSAIPQIISSRAPASAPTNVTRSRRRRSQIPIDEANNSNGSAGLCLPTDGGGSNRTVGSAMGIINVNSNNSSPHSANAIRKAEEKRKEKKREKKRKREKEKLKENKDRGLMEVSPIRTSNHHANDYIINQPTNDIPLPPASTSSKSSKSSKHRHRRHHDFPPDATNNNNDNIGPNELFSDQDPFNQQQILSPEHQQDNKNSDRDRDRDRSRNRHKKRRNRHSTEREPESGNNQEKKTKKTSKRGHRHSTSEAEEGSKHKQKQQLLKHHRLSTEITDNDEIMVGHPMLKNGRPSPRSAKQITTSDGGAFVPEEMYSPVVSQGNKRSKAPSPNSHLPPDVSPTSANPNENWPANAAATRSGGVRIPTGVLYGDRGESRQGRSRRPRSLFRGGEDGARVPAGGLAPLSTLAPNKEVIPPASCPAQPPSSKQPQHQFGFDGKKPLASNNKGQVFNGAPPPIRQHGVGQQRPPIFATIDNNESKSRSPLSSLIGPVPSSSSSPTTKNTPSNFQEQQSQFSSQRRDYAQMLDQMF